MNEVKRFSLIHRGLGGFLGFQALSRFQFFLFIIGRTDFSKELNLPIRTKFLVIFEKFFYFTFLDHLRPLELRTIPDDDCTIGDLMSKDYRHLSYPLFDLSLWSRQ